MDVPTQTGRPEQAPTAVRSELRGGIPPQRHVGQVAIVVGVVARKEQADRTVERFAALRRAVFGILLGKNDVVHLRIGESYGREGVVFAAILLDVRPGIGKKGMPAPGLIVLQIEVSAHGGIFAVSRRIGAPFEIVFGRGGENAPERRVRRRQELLIPGCLLREGESSHGLQPLVELIFEIGVVRHVEIVGAIPGSVRRIGHGIVDHP